MRGPDPCRPLVALALVGPLLSSCAITRIVSWPDGVNALANGSFEEGTQAGGPFKPDSNGVMSLTNGSTAIPGWTVLDNDRFQQDVAWARNANPFVPNGAKDGSHFLDLTGSSDRQDPNHHFGAVKQTFATLEGVSYELRYSVGVSGPNFAGPALIRAEISAAADERPYADVECRSSDTGTGPVWNECAITFKARSSATVLKLFGNLGTRYIGLDDVHVECIAPLGNHGLCGR